MYELDKQTFTDMTGRWSCQAEATAVASMATVQRLQPQLSECDRGLNTSKLQLLRTCGRLPVATDRLAVRISC